MLYRSAHEFRSVLRLGIAVTVSLRRGEDGSEFSFVRAEHRTRVILTMWPPFRNNPGRSTPCTPSWYADLASAHEFLRQLGTTTPIVVSSLGYSFGDGDFEDVTILQNVPHVVVVVQDFYGIWLRLAHFDPRGLNGATDIEWQAMPSPFGSPYFGFVVLKPKNCVSPILLVPCIYSTHDRALSVSDQLPSPHGICLSKSSVEPQEWLGTMIKSVVIAATIFEGNSWRK
jgi:hypothetical protein